MPRSIHIFDFDGTLARTPLDSPENRRLYEKETGVPWVISKADAVQLSKRLGRFVGMRNGWYGRKETLEPPLVPDPAPKSLFIERVCQEFLSSKADPDVATIIMTGRHRGICGQVFRILGDGGLVKLDRRQGKDGKPFIDLADPDVQVFFLGDKGPKPKGIPPNKTLEWKVWMIDQLVEAVYPEAEELKIWEDRDEHAAEFQQLQSCIRPTVIVDHVK